MPNVSVPDGADPLIHVWTALAPKLTAAAGGYSHAVYEHSSLSLREFEAARITMARINDCALCLDWRTRSTAMTSWSTWPCASARGWLWAGSIRCSISTAPAGCLLTLAS